MIKDEFMITLNVIFLQTEMKPDAHRETHWENTPHQSLIYDQFIAESMKNNHMITDSVCHNDHSFENTSHWSDSPALALASHQG